MPSVEKPGSLLDEGPGRRLWKVEGDAETEVVEQERARGAKPEQQTGVGWREMVAIVFI